METTLPSRRGRSSARRRQHSRHLARVEFPALAVADFLALIRLREVAALTDLLACLRDRSVKTTGSEQLSHPKQPDRYIAARVSREVLDALARVLDDPRVEMVDVESQPGSRFVQVQFRWQGP